MIKYESLFNVFSKNLRNNFQRFGLKLQSGDTEILDALYVCPISLRCYTIEGLKNRELTLEHVPPESLGGKGIILTCKELNNKDGHTTDKKLLNFFESENFKASGGEINTKISSEELSFRGITAKFAIAKKDGKPMVQIKSSTQNIKALDYKGLFKNWDGGKFTLTWQQRKNIDKKALLKCAYLMVFSKIGYELIFDTNGFKKETYGVLIEYLRNSESDIDFPLAFINRHAPLSNSAIGMITGPLEYKSFVINLTFKLNRNEFQYAVFLPHPENADLSNLKRLEELISGENCKVDFQLAEITFDVCAQNNIS